jgi:hypothetical protein
LRLAHNGRRLLAALVAVIGCVALLAGVPSRASAAALPSATWTPSSTVNGATGVSYTFTLMPATTTTMTSITLAMPSGPGGVGGTPALSTVTPASIAGGTLTGTTPLTYTLPAATTVPAGLVLSIKVTGLRNPAAGSLTTTITTRNSAGAVDTGTAGFTFNSGTLSSLSWTPSSTAVGATGVSYSYGFTLGLGLTVNQITMSVPPGTAGTPTVASTSPASLLSGIASVALSSNILTVTFSGLGVLLSINTPYLVVISGLTNTPTAGAYTTEITASGLASGGAGTATANFPSGLWAGAPPSLSWGGTLNGQNQALTDTTGADQLMMVNDQTNSAAGWHVTVSATDFVNTAAGYSLPSSGVLGVTGSTAGLFTSTAPTAACSGSAACTLPDNSAVTYPVIINSAASSPVAATVYDAKAGTGVGLMSLGGSAAANPVGWWVNVPAIAAAGSYLSTLTVSVVTGP